MDFSQQIKQSKTDEWYTTRDSVKMVIPYLVRGGYEHILCPFDKEDSNFVKVLSDKGLSVTYSHIDTGTDFFEIEDFSKYDAVVSNPPFSKRQKIFEKLFEVGIPFALIINFNGLFDAKSRWKLFKENEFEILVPCGRMHFFNDECQSNSPNFQSVYVCHKMLPQQIVLDGYASNKI